jgi:hypothetical protein
MPPEFGDWTNREHIRRQARAMRCLAERLIANLVIGSLWSGRANITPRTEGRADCI